MNKMKLVSIILLIALVSMFLISCGSNNTVQDASQDNSSINESIESEESFLSGGRFPIVEERIQLSVTVPTASNVEDITTNEFTKYYEDLTNIAIKWNVIPEESLSEKINISLSSGDLPDIYLNCNISQTQQQVYGSQGAFVALNDYIDAYQVEKHENDELFRYVPTAKAFIDDAWATIRASN